MSKKILIAACAWLISLGHAWADGLSIGNVTVPQGGTAELKVGYNFTSETDKVGFTFSISLPEGISFVKDEGGDPVYRKDETSIDKLNILCVGEGNFAGQPSNSSSTIKGTDGTLLTLTLKADAGLAVGSSLPVSVTKVTFQERLNGSVRDINLDDFTFTVTIGEAPDSHILLDENASVAPEPSGGAVDVRVRRTIAADCWSTICLPFAMTEAQVAEAFGSDVQLASFVNHEAEEDAGGDIVGITVNFEAATSIEANRPCLIKVSEPVAEFTVDGVVIDPQEEDACIENDNGKTGNRRVVYSGFYGTYHSGTVVPEFCLFLNSNNFYYSMGATKMKGYRAYFEFYDVLADVDNAYGVKMFVDGTETKVGAMEGGLPSNGKCYDLSGREVPKAGRGIRIVKGKKVMIK